MTFRAIIFDLEGTIVDTEPLWLKAATRILSTHGLTPAPSFASRIIGTSIEQTCTLLKDLHQLPESTAELAKQLYAQFAQFYKNEPTFVTGFQDFFRTVQKHNLRTAIATNTPHRLIQQIHTQPALNTLFGTHMYAPEDVNNKVKPAPDLYLLAAQKLSVAPAECLAIEDSIPGVTAAKQAGMTCIRLNTTCHSSNTLAGEDLVVPDYTAIPRNIFTTA
jgi:sugar-phosphatase